MNKPILSICIPTYNRDSYLEETLQSIVSQEEFINSEKIEIIISDNCSTDNTKEICNKYIRKFPNKIKYYFQKDALNPDENIAKVLDYANGNYLKLNNDTCKFNEGSLTDILKDINSAEELGAAAILFPNLNAKETGLSKTFDDLINNTGYFITWIGAHCYKKTFWDSLANPNRATNTKLNQVDILGRLFCSGNTVYVVKNEYFYSIPIKNKSGYNVAEIFGKNYLEILYSYQNKEIISNKTIEKSKKALLKFINGFYFDINNEHKFYKTGYFKYLLKYYWRKPYFYSKWIKMKIRSFKHNV